MVTEAPSTPAVLACIDLDGGARLVCEQTEDGGKWIRINDTPKGPERIVPTADEIRKIRGGYGAPSSVPGDQVLKMSPHQLRTSAV